MLSRLIHGARVSLLVAVTGTAVAGGIGMLLGILAGYFGGWVDQVVMRLTDAWLALPSLMFAIFLAALLGPGVSNIIIVFGLIYWTRYARVIRGEVLSLRERDFVRLAQVAGLSHRKIIVRHIVPNVLNTWMVLASLTVGVVIITEASLSFLGLGVPPPTPAWGLMLAEARRTLMARPVVADRASRALHLGGRPGGQPLRRLAAGPPRPAAAKPLMSRAAAPRHRSAAPRTRPSVASASCAPSTASASTIDQGECLGLVGESGSGKTTTCLSILRLLPRGAQIAGGSVEFDGAGSAAAGDDPRCSGCAGSGSR